MWVLSRGTSLTPRKRTQKTGVPEFWNTVNSPTLHHSSFQSTDAVLFCFFQMQVWGNHLNQLNPNMNFNTLFTFRKRSWVIWTVSFFCISEIYIVESNEMHGLQNSNIHDVVAWVLTKKRFFIIINNSLACSYYYINGRQQQIFIYCILIKFQDCFHLRYWLLNWTHLGPITLSIAISYLIFVFLLHVQIVLSVFIQRHWPMM